MKFWFWGTPYPLNFWKVFRKWAQKWKFSKSGGKIATYTLEITLKNTKLWCIFTRIRFLVHQKHFTYWIHAQTTSQKWKSMHMTPTQDWVVSDPRRSFKDLPPGSNGRVNRNVQTRKSQISNWLSWSLFFFLIYDNSREAHSACFYWSESYFDPPNGYPKVEISTLFLKIHVFGSKIRMSPKVDRVWGDPKSKILPKTVFEEISTRSNFYKKIEDFSKKTREVLVEGKKNCFFSFLL